MAFSCLFSLQILEINKLTSGDVEETLNLLKWFSLFFKQTFTGQKYNPVVARSQQTLEPFIHAKPTSLTQLEFCKTSLPIFGILMKTINIHYKNRLTISHFYFLSHYS